MSSANFYKTVAIHILLKYTGYALQLPWENGHVKPLLYIHCLFTYSTHMMAICTRLDICSSGKVKLCEVYPNRVANFGLNRAYMTIRNPNSTCTEYFLSILWMFLICSLAESWTLLRSIFKSLLCIRRCISLFFPLWNVSKYCFLCTGAKGSSDLLWSRIVRRPSSVVRPLDNLHFKLLL